MKPFTTHTGLAAPLPQANIDTDQIIPKQFLTRIERTGFGQFLFHDWRFDNDGSEKSDFTLNLPRYKGASVLIAGKNFGCGSSREHAPWALDDFGFRAIIAPSFADIFYNNCFKVGILPIVLDDAKITELLGNAADREGYALSIDLEKQTVSDGQGFECAFAVDEFNRNCLLNGLDDIGLSLGYADSIEEFEKTRPSWKHLVKSA